MKKSKIILAVCAVCVLVAGALGVRWLSKAESEEQRVPIQEMHPVEREKFLQERFAENMELSYRKWVYNDRNIYGRSEEYPCLTGGSSETLHRGEFIISSWEEYQGLMEAIAPKLLVNQPEPVENMECFETTTAVDTIGQEIDEAFFQEHQLAVVDFVANGSPAVYSRLEDVSVNGLKVEITMTRYILVASTADAIGHAYWVPLPKYDTAYELNVISDYLD